MKKYTVEMCYGLNVSVEVEAETREEAIKVAQQMVDEDKSGFADIYDLEFEDVTYVSGDIFEEEE